MDEDVWQTIAEYRKYEINSNGDIRDRYTKKIRTTIEGTRMSFRSLVDGKRVRTPVRKLRNAAFPELDPW